MRTAVDSSIVLDVLGASPTFGDQSREALRSAYDTGALVACDVVWAEVRAQYQADEPFENALSALGVQFDPPSPAAARLAGQLWGDHRRASPGTRDRLVADFLVGAHAIVQADRLLTRDRGFYGAYFSQLEVLDPSA